MAVKSIYNWAGCAIGGYARPPAPVAFQAIQPFARVDGSSSLLGMDGQVDVRTAALINGIASHADDYDATHSDTPVYPSGPVASALLAIAERKGGVSEMKLGVSVFPEHYDVGWQITSTTGSISATVAVRKIIGMHESFAIDTKPFHVGDAAAAGLEAALLARGGLGASLEGLEAERGWTHVVSTCENVTDQIIHAAIDDWIQIHDQAVEKSLDVNGITKATARTPLRVLFLTDDRGPATGLAGKSSVYHAAAVSMLSGQATPSQFTDEAVTNEAFVTATFSDGTELIEHALGSLENPLDSGVLKTKFLERVTAHTTQETAVKAFEAFSRIANATDVTDLVESFR